MRILVTRPERDAKRTAERLEAKGHKVLCAPLMAVRATAVPPPGADYDIVLVTSANGAARLDALPGWQERIVYAVGPRTGAAVRAMGEARDLRIAAGDAVSMIALITKAFGTEKRIIHVTGVNHKAEPDASLRAAGFAVATWTAYEAVAAQALPQTLAIALTAETLDAVVHYSRRSTDTLLRLAEAKNLDNQLQKLHHFCLSEDVATPLRAAGAERISIALHPSEEALLDRIDEAERL